MDRLLNKEERIIPKDMNFRTALTYKNRQKLYEKRLKFTKALPIIQHEMSELESENESKISLYITQKSKFMASLRMLIDQIDSILRRDDSQRQAVGLPALKTPMYYPSGVDLWVEMPAKIIKNAAEEHEVCMMSIDDARSRQQIKHVGIGKTSKGMKNIPSITSAFQRVYPSMSKGREASPRIKERGCQEAIKMAAEVWDWNKREPCPNAGGNFTQRPSILTKTSSEYSLIEDRKQKWKKVLEQFLREVKRQGRLTEPMEAKMRDDFHRQQEAEEQRLVEEECKRQLERDGALAWKLQKEEEERQIMDEFDKVLNQLTEDLKQQLDSKYGQEMEKLYRNEQMQTNEEIRCTAEPITRVKKVRKFQYPGNH